MSARPQKSIFFFLLLLYAKASLAGQWGVAFGSGEGILHIVPYRLAVSWDFGPIWCEDHNWGLNALWETSLAHWEGGNYESDTVQRLDLVTSGPVFRWQRQSPYYPSRMTPYLEIGIAASWLSETEIGGRKLSLHFQFQDNIGLGARFGRKQQFDLTFRGYHYSNASLKRPNSGVNLLMINFGWWFAH